MRKFTLTLIALLSTVVMANAHNNILGIIGIGGRLGMISSSEQLPTTGDQLKESITAKGTGWTGTLVVKLNIPKLPIYIQPELQYTNTTIKLPSLDIGTILGGEKEPEIESHRYIDMPVLIGAEFNLIGLVGVRVNAGPVFAISSEKGFGDLEKNDFIAAYEDPKMTWTAGVGVSVLNFVGEVRYNGNFNGGKIDTENIAGSIDTNRTSWNISIGMMF